jgi:hypothetical protein
MIHLSPRCILLTLLGLCPIVHACLLMLPTTRSVPTVANRSVSGRHRLDANGFTSRSLLGHGGGDGIPRAPKDGRGHGRCRRGA